MAIEFPPQAGLILVCDYSTGFIVPEMVKMRPALVVSQRPRQSNGLCTVVPLSTTPPKRDVPYQCRITLPYPPPPPFTETEVWAKADLIATVGYKRLSLFKTARAADGRRQYLKMMLDQPQLDTVRTAVRAALGF